MTSQSGQDTWVLEKLHHKRNGYFLEIGAYTGIKYSNTYLLEKEYGWTGICVEPAPLYFPYLVASRSCICENVCIYHSDGQVKFLMRSRKASSAIYDDESPESLKTLVGDNLNWLIDVPTMTLLRLLQKHNAPQVIDYFSLDTEGSEYQILRDFDFGVYTFLTLTVEHNAYVLPPDPGQVKKRQNISELLTKHGYVLQQGNAIQEDWYTHKSLD